MTKTDKINLLAKGRSHFSPVRFVPRRRLLKERLEPSTFLRRASIVGAALLMSMSATVAAAQSGEAAALLQQADNVKTSNYAQFDAIMRQLAAQAGTLSTRDRQYLRYLQGWQNAYDGEYETGITVLKGILDEPAGDLTLRFRARATLTNMLSLAKRYEDAFAQLNELLTLLPEVSNANARDQALTVAAISYNQVGQYDLGLSYAEKLIAENWQGKGICKGRQLKLEALYRSGGAQKTSGAEFQSGIDACVAAGEPTYANVIRTYLARRHFDLGRYDDAINELQQHYEELRAARYPRLISAHDALLAEAHLRKGQLSDARRFALHAVDGAVKNEYTEPLVFAYRVLYLLSKEEGDARAALDYHEKYAAADKAYLDDVSARQLAFQRVKQEVTASRLQIDALNKQNQVLRLERELDAKAIENVRLYVALLILILGFIGFWAYKTKRSQLHFMRLSRRDGLTGIFNRPHFIELAESLLKSCRQMQQEVCLVLCDLDDFKTINDEYGHAQGDVVLKRTVSACQPHLRATDVFARIGGEEFCILLPGCGLETAQHRAEQLRLAIAALDLTGLRITASLGVAGTKYSGYELRQLMVHADQSLYRAKRGGRNRVMLYEAKDTDEPTTESSLKEAQSAQART
jgi:diguanylate cyclase (GGDEF)-like protein